MKLAPRVSLKFNSFLVVIFLQTFILIKQIVTKLNLAGFHSKMRPLAYASIPGFTPQRTVDLLLLKLYLGGINFDE